MKGFGQLGTKLALKNEKKNFRIEMFPDVKVRKQLTQKKSSVFALAYSSWKIVSAWINKTGRLIGNSISY